ncbi:MAG TPA: glycosyl hydrolase, partial [Saprospiraceae bacterium]|nr:glycosyl hydrolase [Saprospiraceae bacterium]
MGNDMTDLLRQSALFRFNESAERIDKCLGMLSEEQILSRPNGVSNSIANILIHLNGNITQYGIRKDIEWMHRSGIGGAHVFDGNMGTPVLVKNRISYMSSE